MYLDVNSTFVINELTRFASAVLLYRKSYTKLYISGVTFEHKLILNEI